MLSRLLYLISTFSFRLGSLQQVPQHQWGVWTGDICDKHQSTILCALLVPENIVYCQYTKPLLDIQMNLVNLQE